VQSARFLATLGGRRLLPSPVLTEVCWLLERWPAAESAFLSEVARGTFELVHLSPRDLTRMSELVLQYADFPLGAVDASVLAIAERAAPLRRHPRRRRADAGARRGRAVLRRS
jgi:predicted nucleic acid-binding protein